MARRLKPAAELVSNIGAAACDLCNGHMPEASVMKRPKYVPRIKRFQLSVCLTERQVDLLERARIHRGDRSWNATVGAVIDGLEAALSAGITVAQATRKTRRRP